MPKRVQGPRSAHFARSVLPFKKKNEKRKNSKGILTRPPPPPPPASFPSFPLKGDKYGYRPPPQSIPTAAFEQQLLVAATPEQREALTAAYSLDTNTVPPVYSLVPDASVPNLAEALRDVAQRCSDLPPDLRTLLEIAITEQEVRLALSRGPGMTYWTERVIVDTNLNPRFTDMDTSAGRPDQEAAVLRLRLRDWVRSQAPCLSSWCVPSPQLR